MPHARGAAVDYVPPAPMTISGILRTSIGSALALAGALFAGCAAPAPETAAEDIVFPDDPYATLTSDDGAFRIEVRTAPNQPPTRGRTYVELRLSDAKGAPIDGAALEVVPFMPDMAHAAQTEPDVEPLGDGRYEVAPVDMVMSGRWDLLTTIEGPVHDSASVTFDIE